MEISDYKMSFTLPAMLAINGLNMLFPVIGNNKKYITIYYKEWANSCPKGYYYSRYSFARLESNLYEFHGSFGLLWNESFDQVIKLIKQLDIVAILIGTFEVKSIIFSLNKNIPI